MGLGYDPVQQAAPTTSLQIKTSVYQSAPTTLQIRYLYDSLSLDGQKKADNASLSWFLMKLTHPDEPLFELR